MVYSYIEYTTIINNDLKIKQIVTINITGVSLFGTSSITKTVSLSSYVFTGNLYIFEKAYRL